MPSLRPRSAIVPTIHPAIGRSPGTAKLHSRNSAAASAYWPRSHSRPKGTVSAGPARVGAPGQRRSDGRRFRVRQPGALCPPTWSLVWRVRRQRRRMPREEARWRASARCDSASGQVRLRRHRLACGWKKRCPAPVSDRQHDQPAASRLDRILRPLRPSRRGRPCGDRDPGTLGSHRDRGGPRHGEQGHVSRNGRRPAGLRPGCRGQAFPRARRGGQAAGGRLRSFDHLA